MSIYRPDILKLQRAAVWPRRRMVPAYAPEIIEHPLKVDRSTGFVDLSVAYTWDQPLVMPACGNVLYVGAASSSMAWCLVRLSNRSQAIPYQLGRGDAGLGDFTSISIINQAQSGAWIYLVWLSEDPANPARFA